MFEECKQAGANPAWLLTGEEPQSRSVQITSAPIVLQPSLPGEAEELLREINEELTALAPEDKRDVLRYIKERKLLKRLLEEEK